MDSTPDLSRRGFKSLTTRMIVWVLLASGMVFLTAVAISSRLARSAAVRAAEQEAFNAAEAARNRVLGVLGSVERSTELLGASLETLHPDRLALEAMLRRFVGGNPDVYGSTASFEPFAFDAGLEWYAPYFYRNPREPGQITAESLATPTYRYWERDWYRLPMQSRRAQWSEPYFDEEGGNTLMVTYTVPVAGTRNGRSDVIGVVTADLQLDWLVRFIGDVRIGRTGYGAVLSRTGRVIAHPDASLLAAQLSADTPAHVRERLAPLVRQGLEHAGGFEPMTIDGQQYRTVFRQVDDATGWTLAALYPERELMADARRLSWIQAAVAAGGLAFLALVVVALSRRLTAPLHGLAERARQLATGDLELSLPPVTSRDELGTLTSAFHHMRDSLKEHIRTLRETTAAKERLESELKAAHRIQMDMLPRERAGGPDEGFEVAAHLVPARSVGGDLYVHFVENGRAVFMLGDVSGKGMAAALFMARAKTLFDALAPRMPDPGALLTELNQRLCLENEHGMFVTGVCGVLDPVSGELTYASAGHDPPLRVRAGQRPEPLAIDGGPMLAIFDHASYPVRHDRLAPGECLMIYTDGVTDATDTGGAMFGTDRLMEAVSGCKEVDAYSLTQGVFSIVEDFARGAPQADDITVLTVRYLGR
ncbi:MAG TPA: SpoIIE family protein phosphatase [Vicinamibacterales bacterium]|nr:SpoIIE family protein phosphatase [Vicinamibacterales bacterium]